MLQAPATGLLAAGAEKMFTFADIVVSKNNRCTTFFSKKKVFQNFCTYTV
jgi:hypothetical protein